MSTLVDHARPILAMDRWYERSYPLGCGEAVARRIDILFQPIQQEAVIQRFEAIQHWADRP